MERPTGPPLGAATQSTGRPMAENGKPRAPLNTVRRAPPPSNIPQAAPILPPPPEGPMSSEEVVALVREAMKSAIEENRNNAEEASGVSSELKPGVTINLAEKRIQKFPEEVVDIIKYELER